MSISGPRVRGAGVAHADMDNMDGSALACAVALVMWLWERLGLEVGEVAVVTDGHRYSRLAALVATWFGAIPVLLLTDDHAAVVPGVKIINMDWSADNVSAVATSLKTRPFVAAAELSGRAEAVDLLLEALPPSSRLMLAGDRRESLTVDFYVNVHRKGLHLTSGILDDQSILAKSSDAEDRVRRARRLLERPARAESCHAVLMSSEGWASGDHDSPPA